MEKNTVFKRFSEESFRLINQTGVSHVHPAAEGNETFMGAIRRSPRAMTDSRRLISGVW